MKIYKFILILCLISLPIFLVNSLTFAQDQDNRPDLIVANIVNLDRNLSIDETRTITIVVGNLKKSEAKNVTVEYLVRNLDLEQEDVYHGYLKGEKNLGTIPAEGTKEFNINYKGVYPAHYELSAMADSNAAVNEFNEANNELYKDFWVEGALTPAIFFAGKADQIDLALDKRVNASTLEPPVGFSVSFIVKVYNHTAFEIWGADLEMLVNNEVVEKTSLETLAPQSEKEFTLYYAFPQAQDYKVKFVINRKATVPERRSDNNSTPVLTVKVKPGVYGTGVRDVAITSFSLSKDTTFQGQTVKAKAVAKNTGKDTLNAVLFTIGLKEQKPFAFKVIGVMAPGQEVSLEATIPALFPGEHGIEARLDGKDIIKEVNENNNVRTQYLFVEKVTKEHVKAQGAAIVAQKVGQAIDAVNRWLQGLGKPKPQPQPQPQP